MAPTRSASSSTSRGGTTAPPPPTRTVANNQGAGGDDDEEWDNLGDAGVDEGSGRKASGKAKSTSTANSTRGRMTSAAGRSKRTNQPSQAGAATDDMDRLSDEEEQVASLDRVRDLEDQLRAMKEANQSLVAQFDELKQIRHTAAETDLKAYKDASEAAQRNSKDLISSLRTRLDQTEKRLKATAGATSSGDDGEMTSLRKENGELKADVDRLRKERNQAHETAERLSHELKTARKQQQSNPALDRLLDVEKEAIRELYEDLTGITIQKVEELPVESDAGDDDEKIRRRFKAFFNAVGHYDLLCSFEESTSSLPASDKNHHQDLIFCPHLDPKVDHDLLENGSLPGHFHEQMRFDRANSVKFLGSLTRGLRRK